MRTITAQGTGLAAGRPDLLTIEMGVRTQASSARAALSAANDQARRLIAHLQSSGVDDRDLATTNLSVFPRYANNGERVVGYEAANVVSAKLRDVDRAGELIDAAASAVGDSVVIQGIRFSIEDPTELLAQARADAVARARRQAEQLAAAAGLELGAIQSLSEATAGEGPMPRMATVAMAESVPLQPGSQQVRLTVTAVFEIV